MGIDVRAITDEEVPAFARTCAAGFGENADEATRMHPRWIALELDRTRAAFDGDELVATSRNYSFELTVPGGALVTAAGVSAVAVLPTHRRRGILTAMMNALLDDAIERGEPVAMLTASEGEIYGRFGFGVTTRAAALEIDPRAAEFVRPRPGGRLRFVTPEEAQKHAPAVFDRVRRASPGAISRSEVWFAENQFHPEAGNRGDVLYESEDGIVQGFVNYGIKDRWDFDPASTLNVRDLVAATPDALHALWRFVCEIDLVRTVRSDRFPVDSPLGWMLTSARALRVRNVADYVWTRVLDVPAALGARTYASRGRIVLEVRDPFRPGGAAAGTFTVEGAPDGASVTAGGTPDLVVDVSTLSAAWLGGVRWSTLAEAGLVEEQTSGSLARADAMFASTPLPYPYTWF
jgi:predicted acetyltransferase